jgi:hypothetical protein
MQNHTAETLAEFKREKLRMTVVVMWSAQDASLAARTWRRGLSQKAVLSRRYRSGADAALRLD